MPQSYGSLYTHIIFSTKSREALLSKQLHQELTLYITPILKSHNAYLIASGGMPDHVHLLIDLGREVSLAVILRELKATSSSWLRRKTGKDFNWQSGYGYFSVSPSHIQQVIHYINNQETHHKEKSFREEFEEILEAAGVQYDPQWVWKDEAE